MFTERQKEIVNKSIDIIATKGIQGLTIKNLSKEIHISEPAIYRHFESKTDILMSILNNFEEVSSSMDLELKTGKGSTVKRIEIMFFKIIEMFSREPSRISVIFSEEVFKNDEKLKNKIVNIMNMKVKAIEDVLLEGQKKGEIRKDIDNKTLALIVAGTLRFMIKQWDLKDQHKNLLPDGKKLIAGLSHILEK